MEDDAIYKKLPTLLMTLGLSGFAIGDGEFVDFDAIAQQPLKACSGERELHRNHFESVLLSKHHQVRLIYGWKSLTLFPDLIFKTVDVYNIYKGSPGGYIACYSDIREGSAYQVPRTEFFVHGLIRTPGVYDQYTFRPFADPTTDISEHDSNTSQLCREHIPSCSDCWAGGNTASFVGMKHLTDKPCKRPKHDETTTPSQPDSPEYGEH